MLRGSDQKAQLLNRVELDLACNGIGGSRYDLSAPVMKVLGAQTGAYPIPGELRVPRLRSVQRYKDRSTDGILSFDTRVYDRSGPV
jgi:hypothetical protein